MVTDEGLGVRWPGHEADHSLPSSAEVKNEWNYTSTSPCVYRGCRGTTLPLLLIVRSVVFTGMCNRVLRKVFSPQTG